MTFAVFAFYLFAITAVTAGLMVVVARNPVHSVLWLILAFLSSSGLFVLLGAEFVAMLLVIVYVGAVAVLFLFVVMMLDVDFAELKGEMAKYMPLGLLIGVVILMQLGIAFGSWTAADNAEVARQAVTPEGTQNTAALGLLLYDKYIHYVPFFPKQYLRYKMAKHTNFYYNSTNHVIVFWERFDQSLNGTEKFNAVHLILGSVDFLTQRLHHHIDQYR